MLAHEVKHRLGDRVQKPHDWIVWVRFDPAHQHRDYHDPEIEVQQLLQCDEDESKHIIPENHLSSIHFSRARAPVNGPPPRAERPPRYQKSPPRRTCAAPLRWCLPVTQRCGSARRRPLSSAPYFPPRRESPCPPSAPPPPRPALPPPPP